MLYVVSILYYLTSYYLAVSVLTRTYPVYPVACPGDRLVFTCITNSGTVIWRGDDGCVTETLIPATVGSLSLIVNKNGNMITSTGTIESVSLSLNGRMVGCSGTSFTQFDLLTINVTG